MQSPEEPSRHSISALDDSCSKPGPPNEPDHDLYTIPIRSSWFSWDQTHETEKSALKEFFNGGSITRTPKIYKEYRDFIINKYREDPSRRLTFTEIRKSLVGDVNLIRKVFAFLENWGLINFGVLNDAADDQMRTIEYEDGTPNGIQVVTFPNSSKSVVPASAVDERDSEEEEEEVEVRFRLPPLTSYSDVFSELGSQKGRVCRNCREDCTSRYHESSKGGFVVCVKCFKNEYYGESKSVDDFRLNDCLDGCGNRGTDVWTDSETLLLLEAVLTHGDDWDLVAQNVRTKNKLDCISRLIQLPFGENMLGKANSKSGGMNSSNRSSDDKQMLATLIAPQEPIKADDQHHDHSGETEQTAKDGSHNPPLKRRRVTSFADASSSLMKQVALLSTIVGPDVAAASAEASVTVLCNENPGARKIFDFEVDNIANKFGSPTSNNQPESILKVEEGESEEREEGHKQSEEVEAIPEKNLGPLTLQVRAAIATALGATAARAKLLADQEDREIEHLMATIIEIQLKKIQFKIKHFEELELIMEKEYAQIQQLKQSIIADRLDVLQQVFSAGISRWRDRGFVKSFTGSIV